MTRSTSWSPNAALSRSLALRALSRFTALLSGPTHRAVVRRREAGKPPGGGGRLPPVRDRLGTRLQSGHGPLKTGVCGRNL